MAVIQYCFFGNGIGNPEVSKQSRAEKAYVIGHEYKNPFAVLLAKEYKNPILYITLYRIISHKSRTNFSFASFQFIIDTLYKGLKCIL